MNNKYEYLDSGNSAVALEDILSRYSISMNIITSHHPDVVETIESSVHLPDGITAETMVWDFICPKCDPVDKVDTLFIMTEPIERFKLLCSYHKIEDIDAKLTELEINNTDTFCEINEMLEGIVRLYKLSDLEAFATDAHIEYPFGDNTAQHLVPLDLTADQTARVEAIYSTDIEIYNSTIGQGEVYDFNSDVYIVPLEQLVKSKRDEIANKRYIVETGGFTLPDGTPVKTDLPTRLILTMAKMNALADPNYVIPNWKLPTGHFVTLTSENIINIAIAGEMFIQSCFDKEATLVAEIENATTRIELACITWE